ncbi:MAG TPA: SDR family oxidoreductase [Stellaceae bacterium]|nr:SDR family oxidoreductase [Stellaceae bacterium]
MSETHTALVVGASRGLGLGLAAELRRRDWNVIATVRDEAGARRLSTEAPGVRVERLDITEAAAVADLRRKLDGEAFDLVFVNAGISPPGRGDAAQVSLDQAATVFVTNAIAPARLARLFLGRLRQPNGVVAFMSSGLGSVADNTHGYSELYSASKAALNSLSRSLAATLGGRRITVLAIAPGWVRTDMGGAGAPLSVEESVRGIVDVLEARAGSGRHGFVDHRGRELPW